MLSANGTDWTSRQETNMNAIDSAVWSEGFFWGLAAGCVIGILGMIWVAMSIRRIVKKKLDLD